MHTKNRIPENPLPLPASLRASLELVAAQAAQHGVRVWLVGGVVRDLLAGLPLSHDLDFAVEGDVAALAAAMASASGGRIVAQHAPFGTASIELPAQDGAPPLLLDLARTRREHYPQPAVLPEVRPAPIEQDLLRRDFSLNAIACELSIHEGRLSFGALLDPFAGQADLAARRLRLLHAQSLRDDPTRILRGLRLASRMALALTPESAAQLEHALAAGYLALLSPERILNELCLALHEARPDAVLHRADAWGITPQILPGLAYSADLAARCERYATSAGPHDPLVWMGLLCYACAPATRTALLRRYPLPNPAATLLRQLEPLRTVAPRLASMPNSALDRTLHTFSMTACIVLHFAEPDAAAPVMHYLHQLRPQRAPLDGHDLRRLGVAPGPRFGQLLAQLRDLTLDGQMTTRAQAEAWVLQELASSEAKELT
ncbi:MAG: CCA tRNA nucleotidyltransferase [Candidatus Viridilinea halotolerans]|uniref:CCA tRNA nucleotidyltransferase n=1 Tax=Candidatus Viridilinea halotolerans TaxID=2491704 RepID=A0A426UAJ8_9CHLR|nr:MAG: CCA tRNA nucleotidyltransferase [Candidatus Viridilinea halotolerans]